METVVRQQQNPEGKETNHRNSQLSSNSDAETQSQSTARPESLAVDRPLGGTHERIKTTKRACTNCRQQKLRCDVIRSPFSACSRCRHLGKGCTIETDLKFKRINKRDKCAEMQREIDELRRKLQLATEVKQASADQSPPKKLPAPTEAPASLLPPTKSRQLGDILVSGDILDSLYSQYFTLYHPFLPLLDPQYTSDHYFGASPFLGWSVVMVSGRRFPPEPELLKSLTVEYFKLLWSTIAEVPHSHHVIKALCLLCFWPKCFWPKPTSPTFTDPTFHLSGMIMQIAYQSLLHLPFQAQDFSRRTPFAEPDQRDRLITWAACNIVAQNTSSVYGLPPQTSYGWVLGSDFRCLSTYQLPKDLVDQLRIAQYCNTVTKTLYCDSSESNGTIPEAERSIAMSQLSSLYAKLETAFGAGLSIINRIHMLAANVQLHAFAFFLSQTDLLRETAFFNLYKATCTFLQKVMDQETSTGTFLENCSTLISQTVFSATFVLLRLLNSSIASKIDTEHGKALFNGSLLAARKISVQDNDIASRVATRVPQMWKEWGAGGPWSWSRPDPLVLKKQYRMSVSHIYDCMWQWRELVKAQETRAQAGETSTAASVASVSMTTAQAPQYDSFAAAGPPAGPSLVGLSWANYDMFDSMDWMLGEWADVPLAQ